MYNKVLSEIHDKWFRSIPENVADHIEAIANSLASYNIVDLDCGSGVLLNRLKRKCKNIYGFDIPSKMITKCKKRIPDGHFETKNIFDVDIPESNVVVMVGEILSYSASSAEHDSAKVGKFLSYIFHKKNFSTLVSGSFIYFFTFALCSPSHFWFG